MRKAAAIVLAAAMSLSLMACGSQESASDNSSTTAQGAQSEQAESAEAEAEGSSEEGIKIGVSAPDLTNVFFIQIKDAMEAALQNENDEIIIQDAGSDQNKQMNDVADMISQGCDVICISAINSEGVRATLEACKEADIPVIAFNTAVKNSELVECTVVSDNVEAPSVRSGLGRGFDGKGKIVEITYSTTEVCYDRQMGFEEELKNYPEMEIIQTRDVEKARSDYSQPVMVDFLNANPQIDGVFTINDPTARGAIAALKEAGRLEETKVVAIDGSDEGKDFIRAGEMVASAAQDPEQIGTTCIETAYKLLAGEEVEENVVVPMSIITAENVDEAD